MKSSKYKFKIIYGYRKDQSCTIDANEIHKAYYLFLNPTSRTVFNNGLALTGKNIISIQPDYNATMGWNPTHELDEYDHEEIQALGIDRKLQSIASEAKQFAYSPDIRNHLQEPFAEVVEKYNLAPAEKNTLLTSETPVD